MARTPGTEGILEAAAQWKDRCLLADGSVFSDATLWTRAHVAELIEHFVEKPDEGSGTFLEKFHDQLESATPGARQLAAEMLWFMFLFPNNVSEEKKVENVKTVWEWSGAPFDAGHPLVAAMAGGIGSGGQGYNTYRPFELQLFIRLMEDWKSRSPDEQRDLVSDPWRFAEWVDTIEGADKRQFRHMLLHLIFPDTFERVSSGAQKSAIDAALADEIAAAELTVDETGQSLLARDRRLLRIRRALEQEQPGIRLDFYEGELARRWKPVSPPGGGGKGTTHKDAKKSAESKDGGEPGTGPYVEPELDGVVEAIQSRGLRVDERTIRRYHLALHSRGFVILSGVSGTGKTWLAEAYAQAVEARHLVVPVAPNWTTNEDLLGYADPFSGAYRDTAFSQFLREAAAEHKAAGRAARPYHLILDEMNLARVEYYFAKFLSVMELRMRGGEARIELGPKDVVTLPPNLRFVGTVNIDETTHGFADKVYDRAQLIEIPAHRSAIEEHLTGTPYKEPVLAIWDAVRDVAPFAFRVLDDFGKYIESAKGMDVAWQELVDELVLQKVLPKLKGTDPRVGDALATLETIVAGEFPLSLEKVKRMRAGFQQHGFASYF